MAKCGACGKFLSPVGSASCSNCPAIFHKACVLISGTSVISKAWTCPDCKNKIRRGDNSSTPVRNVCDQDTTTSCESSADLSEYAEACASTACASTACVAGTATDAAIRELRQELAEYMDEIRSEVSNFRKEMRELRASVLRVTERVDSLELRLEAIEQSHKAPGSPGTVDLEKQVIQLKTELNDRDQETLLSDLEIGHLPEERGENVIHALSVLAVKLGVRIEERDIVYAERVGAPPAANVDGGAAQRPRRVVVRLARRQLRDELLRAARVRRTLTADDTGRAIAAPRIYINERLTRVNRSLFYRAREMCRKLQWQYTWTRRGRVYVRQGIGKPVHIIKSDDDMQRVFGTVPV